MNKKPSQYPVMVIGFVQAMGIVAYVLLFATLITQLQHWPDPPPLVAIPLFLTTFIVSALVCSSTVLGYPIVLALRGEIRRAIGIVVWTGMLLVFGLLLTVAIVQLSR